MWQQNRPEDHEVDNFDITADLHEEHNQSASPLIIGAAVAGLAIGLFLWGSIALSAFSAVNGLFDDDASVAAEDATNGNEEPTGEPDVAIDCDAFGPTRALSPEQEAAFQEQCVTPTPEPDEQTETTPSGDATVNREDCDEIRGTDYRSPGERQWFLGNCVN